MEVRQLPSTQALEAKLSRMSYPAAKDHEAMLHTAGKLTITDVAKISFFFCFVVSGWQFTVLNYRRVNTELISKSKYSSIYVFKIKISCRNNHLMWGNSMETGICSSFLINSISQIYKNPLQVTFTWIYLLPAIK